MSKYLKSFTIQKIVSIYIWHSWLWWNILFIFYVFFCLYILALIWKYWPVLGYFEIPCWTSKEPQQFQNCRYFKSILKFPHSNYRFIPTVVMVILFTQSIYINSSYVAILFTLHSLAISKYAFPKYYNYFAAFTDL